MDEEIEREVAATLDEFGRGLKLAFPGAVSGGPLRFAVVLGEAAMDIELDERSERSLGALRLPRLAVRIRLSGAAAARRALLDRLDLATHRGGG